MKDGSPCEGWFPRFYHDSLAGVCKEFIFGGCPNNSNGNNFATKEECDQRCILGFEEGISEYNVELTSYHKKHKSINYSLHNLYLSEKLPKRMGAFEAK